MMCFPNTQLVDISGMGCTAAASAISHIDGKIVFDSKGA